MAALGAKTPDDLLHVCKDASRAPEQRALACLLLGEERYRASVPALLNIAESEEEPLVVWQALSALGAIGDGRVLQQLIHLVRTAPSSLKRRAAVFAIVQFHTEKARPVLEKVLLHPHEAPETRGLAAEGLGLLRVSRKTLRILVRVLQDSSPELRYSALCALAALRSPAALPAVKRLQNDKAAVDGGAAIADRAAQAVRDIEVAQAARRERRRNT